MHRTIQFVVGIGLIGAVPTLARALSTRQTLVELNESDERVARIGLRLLTANAPRCARLMPGTGMVLHSLAQYSGPARSEALALWRFPSPVSLLLVVTGGPADRAGLHSGDGLIGLADRKLTAANHPGAGSTRQRDETEEAIASLRPGAPIKLTVLREGQTLQIELIPTPACRSRLEVVAGTAVKARSDGETIQLGEAFVRRLSDEELAVAIAHELAHTILEHRRQLAQWEAETAKASTKSLRERKARGFEDEADLLSLQLLAAAGWNPAAAPGFMRKHGRRYDPAFFGKGVHRSAEDRARRMERAIPSIQAQR